METYINDAELIWADFKNRLNTDKVFRELDVDDQLEFYQKNHHRFTMTFPIVLRYMIQLKQYDKKAFIKFIQKLTANPYRSELEYCERQADYVKYLFMETSRNHNMKDAQTVWKDTYDMLEKEVKAFKEAEEKVKQKMEKNNNANGTEKRKELKSLMERKY